MEKCENPENPENSENPDSDKLELKCVTSVDKINIKERNILKNRLNRYYIYSARIISLY